MWFVGLSVAGFVAGCVTTDKYLDAVRQQPGVVAMGNGLLYEILRPGTGAFPKATDTVRVNYTGWFTDGRMFDSSASHGGAVEFPLNQVIPGWTQGVQKINVGGKIKLYLPSDLAYGERGAPGTIPPNSTLVFEIELLGITSR